MKIEAQVALVVIASLFVFSKGVVDEGACRPYPVPADGWDEPFAVAVGDSVVEWHPNESAASRRAFGVAYRHPGEMVRVASVMELRWRSRDGAPCRYGEER